MALMIYASKTQLTDDHTMIVADTGAILYIRAIPFQGTADEALDHGLEYQLEGEKFLSSIDLQHLG